MKTIAFTMALAIASSSSTFAATQAIAPGAAVDTLQFFVGESVDVQTKDGRHIVGMLKGVTSSAVVIVDENGAVTSVRPEEVVGLVRGEAAVRSPAKASVQPEREREDADADARSIATIKPRRKIDLSEGRRIVAAAQSTGAKLEEDLEFDVKAALVIGGLGVVTSAATAIGATSIEGKGATSVAAVGGIASSVLLVAASILGIKAAFENMELSKLQSPQQRQ
jgi:hypothetical protein